MKFKAKDRMALINKATMKRLTKYFKNDGFTIQSKKGNTAFDLSWAVNYLVNIAIGELEEIDEMLNKKK